MSREKSFIQPGGGAAGDGGREEQLETLAEINKTVRGIQEDNCQLREKQDQLVVTLDTVEGRTRTQYN